jgi:hypothetical protein
VRIRRGALDQLEQNAACVPGVDEVDLRAAGTGSWCIIKHPHTALTQNPARGPDIWNSVSHVMETTSTASHEKALEHGVFGKRQQQLKLIATRSALSVAQHHLGHLLVQVVFTMHHLETQHVTIEGNRRVQVGDSDTDMIKTEQIGQHTPKIGGHSGHGH